MRNTTILRAGRRALRWFRQPGTHRMQWRTLVELVVFAWSLPLLGRLLFGHDPLGLQSGFPWVVLGPVVFAARYGSGPGFACALLAGAAFVLPHAAYADRFDTPLALAIGTLVLATLVGDGAGHWRRRSLRQSAENDYLRDRLQAFATDYHVLHVSHGQLEQYMAGQRLSLREALQRLRPVLSNTASGLAAGDELMAVFAQFCAIQSAGLYTMKSPSVIELEPVSTYGDMGELPVFDPLLREALRERRMVSVKLDALANDNPATELLAVVPIVDARARMHGVLVVKDMHFMAFQQDNLNLMALLADQVGELLSRQVMHDAGGGERFVSELDMALRGVASHAMPASLVCLELDDLPQAQAVAVHLASIVRGLDTAWLPPQVRSGPVVVLLLPFVSEAQCRGYLQRAAESVRVQFEFELDDLLVDARCRAIRAADTRLTCLSFITANEGRSLQSAAGRSTTEPVETDHLPADGGQSSQHDSQDERRDDPHGGARHVA